MRAAVLVDKCRLELRDIRDPEPGPHQVVVRMTGVGICGTDLHIYSGHANYHYDERRRPIPLTVRPQILGHELSGIVEEVGREVADLRPGEQVVMDQGLSCAGQRIDPRCEFCDSGDSHQCLHYREHGITGVQGGFAEYVAIAGVNVIPVEGRLPRAEIALTEPLGCVLHAVEMAEEAAARYTLGGERRARNALVLGAGPAGILFLQYLRNVRRFDGPIYVVDLNPAKLKLAAAFGAIPLAGTGDDLVAEVSERTGGEKIYYLVEATGAGAVFEFLPGLLRKQATVILYGHGHQGADMQLLNNLQFLEPSLICPAGASGGFDHDGRPLTYRSAMRHLVEGRVRVSSLITDSCNLSTLPDIFARESSRPDFIKAVLIQDSDPASGRSSDPFRTG